jgi:peroxiredoxin (alkyl hydroperoxide reductase subunit C)
MNAWAKDQGIEDEVAMLPDGSGHFTRAMGFLVDKDELGFGMRSWRYSMLVKDQVIEKMFVEDRNQPGDPFEVSDARTMYAYLTESRAAASSG